MARSLHYPTLEFFGGWGTQYTSQAADTDFGKQLFESNYVWNYGLELNIPIYQRHYTKTEKVKANMLFENSKLVEKDLRLMIFREVQTAYLNFLAAKNEYYAAEKQFNASLRRSGLEEAINAPPYHPFKWHETAMWYLLAGPAVEIIDPKKSDYWSDPWGHKKNH